MPGLRYSYREEDTSSSSDTETSDSQSDVSDSPTEAFSSQTELSYIRDTESDGTSLMSDSLQRWHIEQMNALDAEMHRDLEQRGLLDADFVRDDTEEDPRGFLRHAWFSTRAAELEDFVTLQEVDGVFIRNEGNILEDLKILAFMQTEHPDRYDSIRAGFESLYEISVLYKARIIAAPELVIKAFNDLADTKWYWEWMGDPASWEEIQKVCRTVIGNWIEYVDGPEGEVSEDDIGRMLFTGNGV